MPGFPDRSEDTSDDNQKQGHKLQHPLVSTSKVSISWGRGNKLRLSYLQSIPANASPKVSSAVVRDGNSGGKVVEVRLGASDNDFNAGNASVQRRLAYESLPAYALLQNRKQMLLQTAEVSGSLPSDWWEIVLDYSHSISTLLGSCKDYSGAAMKHVYKEKKETEGPTVLKAVWDLLGIVYVDKHALSWLPEQLIDWLQSYDGVISGNESTICSKLVAFQPKLLNLRFPENDREYWDCIASALAVGWLDVVVKFLRMHGSYQHDQIDARKTENGLVEAVAVLISEMPRMRSNPTTDNLGKSYSFKPEFAKAWERWRNQIAKLNVSAYWSECTHQGTILGLKSLLRLLLGDIDTLVVATTHWMELLVSQFLFIRPFSMISEGMLSLARKCIERKPPSKNDKLLELVLAIMAENTEVVLVECSKLFDPWMLTHIIELLPARNPHARGFLFEERDALGGISLEELHRLVYAQLLSSHPCSWQLAPVYLASCPRLGCGLLENLLLMQPVSSQSQLALKVLDICRIYDLQTVAEKLMRVLGVYHWKHGKKGIGISWLQHAHEDRRLAVVANELFSTISQANCGDSNTLKELEGLIDVLGPEFEGLSFLPRYRDFKVSLNKFQEAQAKNVGLDELVAVGKEATKCLMQLMKGQVTPQQFWFPLLRESVNLLEFPEEVLVTVAETNTLLLKLQGLSLSSMPFNMRSWDSPTQSLDRVRLALACNLGRAILKE